MESIGTDLETMKRVPLADAHVAALSEIGEERWYAKGEMIARVGERMDRFIYLIEGEVEIVDPYSGDRLLDAVLGPTQFLGDIGLLHASAHFLGARAVSDTRTLEASREQMLELMGHRRGQLGRTSSDVSEPHRRARACAGSQPQPRRFDV